MIYAKLRLFALSLILLMGVVGQPIQPAQAAANPTANPTTIKVGYIPILAAAPLFVTIASGWATENNMTLELTKFESGPNAIQALAAGQIDLMYAGVGPVIVARAAGAEISIIGNCAVEELVLAARGDLAETWRNRGNKSAREVIAELAKTRGRPIKIATQPSGSVPDTVLRYWLSKTAKLDEKQVEIVRMGIENTQQALLAGAVDAATIREPTVTIIQDKDPKLAILAAGSALFANQPGTVIAVSDGFKQKNKDVLVTLMKLHKRAIDVIARDPKQASILIQDYLGKGLIEPAQLQRAMGSPYTKFTANPYLILNAARRMRDFQREIGVIAKDSKNDDGFDFTFYDAAK
ncbi:MAG: ABC transporter substrate-binding protein [Candidatus Symbiobacter sp.]|nr:ABC transporter substrate-binding protein [Candidatus Symbiobacter sp.]